MKSAVSLPDRIFTATVVCVPLTTNMKWATAPGNGREHPGPNLVRLQKRCDTLLMGICIDYHDQYQPDFQAIIPSLRSQAPYLTDKNSTLFFGDGRDAHAYGFFSCSLYAGCPIREV